MEAVMFAFIAFLYIQNLSENVWHFLTMVSGTR